MKSYYVPGIVWGPANVEINTVSNLIEIMPRESQGIINYKFEEHFKSKEGDN